MSRTLVIGIGIAVLLGLGQAPDRMTITETASMVIITTGDGRTTRLSTDGHAIKDESTGIERKTHWEAGLLISEVSGASVGPRSQRPTGRCPIDIS